MLPVTRMAATFTLVVAVFVTYGPSLENGFVFDDAMFVRDDPRVQSLEEAPRLFVEPLWGYMDAEGVSHLHQYYRPLQTFPLALLRAAFPGEAWPAHLLNVLLHAANVLLVWSIFRFFLGRESVALACALLYAIHPGYSEAILWVSNLAGLGVALCVLAAFRLHLAGAPYILIGAAFFGGLMFHEIGVITPVLILAYEVIAARPRPWRRIAGEWLVFAPLLAAYGWLRLNALGGVVPGLGEHGLSPEHLWINAVGLIPQFLATFVRPSDLNMYHDFTVVESMNDPRFVAGAVVIVSAAVVFLIGLVRARAASFAIAWIALTMAPYLVVRWPQLNVFAERYLYLPAIGAFLLVGLTWQTALRWERASRIRRPLGAVLTGVAVVVGIAIVWQRTPDWHDDVTLYTKTLTQSERAILIRNNLAVRLLEEERYADGIDALEAVIELGAATPETWHNLGLLRHAAGDDKGALAAFKRASRYGQVKWPTLLNLGYLYDRAGERRQAIETYMRLLDQAPEYTPAWFNLAAIAFENGQFENARTAVAHVLQSTPDDAEAQALDAQLRRLKNLGRKSVPADREATRKACRGAMRLAQRGRYRQARVELQAAAWLDEGAALPYQYLANIAALRAEWDAALAAQRAALERAPSSKLYRRNLEALEQRLKVESAK